MSESNIKVPVMAELAAEGKNARGVVLDRLCRKFRSASAKSNDCLRKDIT
jgi:hypothetical protein